MDTEMIPSLRKIVEYQDSARMVESISKIMEVSNAFIQELTGQLIKTITDNEQARQRMMIKLIECFNKNIEATTASYCDNMSHANEVFERRLEQHQRDVAFPKFFSILNKNNWSKKAWDHAFEDYAEHVGMINRTFQGYNESLAFNYVHLFSSCLNLLNSGEQPKQLNQNPVPLLNN